jgi:hypothetical protein
MADVRPTKRGGKYCVAGGRNNVSCQNTSYSPAISMHYFPSDPALRLKWTRFVQIHRAYFKPTNTSVLCSAHFEPSCFTQNICVGDIGQKSKRLLIRGAFPTKDTVSTVTEEISKRGNRQVSRSSFELIFCILVPELPIS